MTDDVLINKAATIKRGVKRASKETPATRTPLPPTSRGRMPQSSTSYACEATLDIGQHPILRERLGIPQSARDVFTLLAQSGWIDNALADSLKRMVDFATSPCMTIRPCNYRSRSPS